MSYRPVADKVTVGQPLVGTYFVDDAGDVWQMTSWCGTPTMTLRRVKDGERLDGAVGAPIFENHVPLMRTRRGTASDEKPRPIFEVAGEMIDNVSHGQFGEAFSSVIVSDSDDDDVPPSAIVIVAKGESAARLARLYHADRGDE